MKKWKGFNFLIFILAVLSNNLCANGSASLQSATAQGRQNVNSDTIVNIHDFNISGDSTTDYTLQIQQVLNDHDNVYFPAGKYLISKSLVLNDHQTITGDGPSSVLLAPDGAGAEGSFAFMTIRSKKNISISNMGMELRNTPKFSVTAVKAINVAYLKIKKVNAINCGIVETWVDQKKYSYDQIPVLDKAGSPDEVSNFFIEVDSCSGVGAKQGIAEHTTGILLSYANHWKVTNSTLTGYDHGVQWWGGDSNPARNGDTINIRKSKNGVVHNVDVKNIRGGGIWGSMGEDVTVSACSVSYCKDVGIDFEGCYNSKAVDNHVENCINGGLATFHYNKNILFDKNNVVQDNPGHALARIYNAAQRQDNGKVVFQNNTFTATKGIGFIDQRGPSRHIEFLNNVLNNVVLNLSFNNNNFILIKDNTLNITRKVASRKYFIKAGRTHYHGKVVIETNHINSTVKQDSSLYAISVHQSDYNTSPVNYLKNNKIEGLSNHIKIEWTGANGGVVSKTYIETDKPIPDTSVVKIDNGKRRSELYINNKRQP